MKLEDLKGLSGSTHDAAVAAIAKMPESKAAEILAGLRQLGLPAADAFENLAWEASFERRKPGGKQDVIKKLEKLEGSLKALETLCVVDTTVARQVETLKARGITNKRIDKIKAGDMGKRLIPFIREDRALLSEVLALLRPVETAKG
jgi:hypothetical protein